MFTDNSIFLRDYFFPRITLKNSIEFQKVYNHFESVKLLPINISNYRENSKKKDIKIQSNSGPERIIKKKHVLNKSSIQFNLNQFNVQINIYDNQPIPKKTFDHLIKIIQFVASLSKIIISELIINIYLLDDKKEIHKNIETLTKDEVNSGSCQRSEPAIITIYRKEELLKVTIHELIHAFQFDNYEDSPSIIKHYQNKYNISSSTINTNEAYTEIWANIINCYLISQRVGRDKYNLFLILVSLEEAFSNFQYHKVIYLTKMFNKTIDINEYTNVLSYYVIRNELYQRIVPFLRFCKTKNKDYIKLTKKKEWFEFLKKNGKLKKNNKRFNSIKKNNYLFTTMRMSLNELSV